jgi:hypothetical protein
MVEIQIPILKKFRWKMLWNVEHCYWNLVPKSESKFWFRNRNQNWNSDDEIENEIEIPISTLDRNRNSDFDIEILTKSVCNLVEILISAEVNNRNRNLGKSKHRNFNEIRIQFCRNLDFVESKKNNFRGTPTWHNFTTIIRKCQMILQLVKKTYYLWSCSCSWSSCCFLRKLSP